VLRNSDEAFADEKLLVTMVATNEQNVKEQAVSYHVLPRAKACSEAEAGIW
jgi:hypothetical protein